MFEDLRSFIAHLKEQGEVTEVSQELRVRYEIPAAIKLIAEQYGSVSYFKKVKGYDVPIIANLLGSKERLAMAMGVEANHVGRAYLKRTKKKIKPSLVRDGPVKENILARDFDITRVIPVLTHHQKDAGPYLTTGIVVAKDPETGIKGMGIHRIQVKGPRKLGIFLNSPPVATFLTKAEKRKQPLEIAVVLGTDPLTFFSSVVWAPQGIDKFEIAGGLSGRSVALVKCESVDLEVPANAEFVIEGKVFPGKREIEGPFGETSGYYLSYNNPVAEAQVLTHRNDPIYHALLPHAGEEEVLIDFSWQMGQKSVLLRSVPGLKDVRLSNLGSITIAQITKREEGDGVRVIKELFDCGRANKIIIVVDDDVDIHSDKDVWWAIATRFQPHRDVLIRRNMPGLGIDPSATQTESVSSGGRTLIAKTSKIGIDATKPLDRAERFERIRIRPDISRKIAALLNER